MKLKNPTEVALFALGREIAVNLHRDEVAVLREAAKHWIALRAKSPEEYERSCSLINAARGRDTCGINHDELIESSDTVVNLRIKVERLERVFKVAMESITNPMWQGVCDEDVLLEREINRYIRWCDVKKIGDDNG